MTLARPILTPDRAALLIRDGVTVAIGGSGAGHSIPERMLEAIGRRHHSSGAPRELTLIHPFGVGDQGARGLEHMAMPGLYRRVIGGHWSMSPSMARLAAENLFEAYCLPAGILVQLFHAGASGSPGWISEIGLRTFIDPRVEGGKLNARAASGITIAQRAAMELRPGAAYDSTAIIGTGGFIDIAQNARKVVFCGTLAVRGGKPKFVPAVRQITFSGAHAISTGQEVLYVTEAAVFRLTAPGLRLEEVAPSLDLQRDVVAKMAFRPLFAASLGSMRAELFAAPLLPADCFPVFP